jgi:hypothetical protein
LDLGPNPLRPLPGTRFTFSYSAARPSILLRQVQRRQDQYHRHQWPEAPVRAEARCNFEAASCCAGTEPRDVSGRETGDPAEAHYNGSNDCASSRRSGTSAAACQTEDVGETTSFPTAGNPARLTLPSSRPQTIHRHSAGQGDLSPGLCVVDLEFRISEPDVGRSLEPLERATNIRDAQSHAYVYR